MYFCSFHHNYEVTWEGAVFCLCENVYYVHDLGHHATQATERLYEFRVHLLYNDNEAFLKPSPPVYLGYKKLWGKKNINDFQGLNNP